MNSSAYLPVLAWPPTIVITIFTFILILLIAPYVQEIEFAGTKFQVPKILKNLKGSLFSISIISLLILCIFILLPVKPFSCKTHIAEIKSGEAINVRTYPSTNSKVIFSLPDGTKINVINIKYGWVRINKYYDNGKVVRAEGFMAANRTKAAIDCSGLFVESSDDLAIK